ncbi:hypothetical protein [Pediococcus ethanolidurans]
MNYRIIKKYIASHLATPTASLTEVTTPTAGILFKNGDNSSFFYLDANDQNVFFEKHDELLYQHSYDPSTHDFTTVTL